LSDFIGLGNQRIPLPFHIPYRLHIALMLIGAIVLLIRRWPRVAVDLAVVIGINLLWWLSMVNKSPRYITMLAPIFAITVGAGLVAAAKNVRWKRAAVAAGLVCGLSQLAGNAFVIYRYRSADYEAVGRRLREIIPPAASVYGAVTFYLALHDRQYYSYARLSFPDALALHPQYLILYDRVMMHGSGSGLDDFRELRTQASEFVKEHATLAGRISNEFYGDMEVYRVN
jgi:hypothetical protein